MGAAALILLIASANVASLLLARNSSRSSELALRKAIGAGQLRLVRQLLTETTVIALIGGLAGVALAQAGLRLLIGFAPPDIPRLTRSRSIFRSCSSPPRSLSPRAWPPASRRYSSPANSILPARSRKAGVCPAAAGIVRPFAAFSSSGKWR